MRADFLKTNCIVDPNSDKVKNDVTPLPLLVK